ncbi:hypothetical protein MKC74_05875 [[Clostridium] innocuum]|nr:hypothetical protein [[Clostridium] innocuum]
MQLLIKDLNISGLINNQWIMDNCYIAGGACVSNATRQPIHDVDIYFKTKDARDLFIEQVGDDKYITKTSNEWQALLMYDSLLTGKVIEVGDNKCFDELKIKISSDKRKDNVIYIIEDYAGWIEIPEPLFEKQRWMFDNGYDYVLLERNHFEVNDEDFLGNKSITLKRNDMVYQFILRFYGDAQEMMDKTFDFQHCKIAYDLATREYITTQETWEALSKRELHYANSFYPVSSLKRLYKYGGRGFKWDNDEFVKIIRDIHKVDTDNKFVMEDQLIGYYEDFDYNDVFCD